MLRSGPGVGFCAGLIAAVVTLSLLGATRFFALGLVIVSASVLVTLSATGRPLVDPAVFRLWLPATAGVLVGAFALPEPATLGMPLSLVRSFQAVALEDSLVRAHGGHIHRLALERVGDGQADADARGSVQVVDAGSQHLWAGDRVAVSAALRAAGRLDRDDFRAFTAGTQVRRLTEPQGILGLRRRVRESMEIRIRQMGHPVSGFFLALFTGDRSSVDRGLETLFRDSGCLHVLALSGAHLVLVWGIAHLAVRGLPWAGARAIVPLAGTLVYVALAGPLPSLLRALAMLIVAWCAKALDREPGPLDVLGLALALVVLVEPRMVFDLSLQLSVAAVAGMVTVGTALAERIARHVPRVVALPLCAGVGAQTMVAPILIAATGVFQPVGVVSGLVVAPLSSAFLVTGLADLAIPVEWLPAVHGLMGQLLRALYGVLVYCLELFSAVPVWRSAGAVGLWCLAVMAALAARPATRAVWSRVGRAAA